ncbi:MAG: hypothetical protein ABI415_09970 [Flavitalea sp.]
MIKAASVDEIKKELLQLPPKKAMDLVLRLARFKKENKELLSYLLFESGDTPGYIQSIEIQVKEQLDYLGSLKTSDQKKGSRKILRLINRQAKYIGTKEAHVQMLHFYCVHFAEIFGYPELASTLATIFFQQVKKITQLLPEVDEDLRHDYERWLELLDPPELQARGSNKKRWWVYKK